MAAAIGAEPARESPAPASPDVQLSLDRGSPADLRIAQGTEGIPEEKVKPDIWYVPTPQRLVDLMLLMAEVNKNDVLYDLGSGDGRLVITAAKRYGARAIGIDIDPEMIAQAQNNAVAAKVEDKVQFKQQDLFKSDFRDATVITLYLLDELNVRLRPHILAQVKPGTRIVSHAFRMGEWEPDAERSIKINETSYDAFFWVVPANMSGRWRVRGAGKGMPEVLLVEQKFQRFTVRRDEAGEVIGEGSLSGKDFVLTIHVGSAGKRTTFTGTIENNSLKARTSAKNASWTAERDAGSEKALEPPK